MYWEFSFLSQLRELHGPVMNQVMAVLSNLGNAGIFWIILAIILLFSSKTRRAGAEIIISLVLSLIIGNLILKNVVNRDRPYEVYSALVPLISKPVDASFPSGHTMSGFAAAASLFLNNRRAGIPALILAGLIAFSRMYNLVHFPTDVIAGAVIGVAIAVLVHVYLPVLRRRLPGDLHSGDE